jgi:16S rRNA (cytosine967-C5)-methyltransferase
MQPLPFGQSFERVLVDAPCSGTGTLARNPEIKWRLTSEDIDRLAVMQRAILSNALSALAPGGRLVYATCSLEPEENEKVVQSVLAATSDCRLLSRAELADNLPEIAPLIDERGYFHTRPDLDGMDGFFAAAMSR